MGNVYSFVIAFLADTVLLIFHAVLIPCGLLGRRRLWKTSAATVPTADFLLLDAQLYHLGWQRSV